MLTKHQRSETPTNSEKFREIKRIVPPPPSSEKTREFPRNLENDFFFPIKNELFEKQTIPIGYSFIAQLF